MAVTRGLNPDKTLKSPEIGGYQLGDGIFLTQLRFFRVDN